MLPNQEAKYQDNRTRILDAATAAFMEKGYRASVDDIVARAGVVKQTLYNHFECKELLFEEAVRNATRSVLVTLEGDSGDLRLALIRFAAAVRERTLSPEGLAMFRTIVGEAHRFPEIASMYFKEGPEQAHVSLAAFLGRAMKAGKLRRDDPYFAAEMLIGMLQNNDRLRGLVHFEHDFLCKNVDKTEKIVDCFLHAYET